MQTFEDSKDSAVMLHIDAYSIVGHREPPLTLVSFGRNLDPRRRRASILDCISDQVLKKLNELDWLPLSDRE